MKHARPNGTRDSLTAVFQETQKHNVHVKHGNTETQQLEEVNTRYFDGGDHLHRGCISSVSASLDEQLFLSSTNSPVEGIDRS